MRIGFDEIYDNCESFECSIIKVNLNSPGIPYLLQYNYQITDWLILSSHIDGGFYFPTKTQISSTRVRKAYSWQQYVGLQLAIRI